MRHWSPSDVIVFTLALVVSLVILVAVVKPLFSDKVMTPEGAKLVGGLVGSMIAIISMYIGGKINKK